MRTSLAPYLNDFVLCRGWITFWEELPELSTRRVVVSQATIKKANKNLLYEKQEVISTEHHLNLFIKHDDLPNYEIIFELNEIINFTGVVEKYTRTDGTQDYGIYAKKQSTLPFEIEQLLKSSNDAYTSMEDFAKSIDYLNDYSYPKTKELINRLEECGDMLPTFHRTYDEYLAELISLRIDIPIHIKRYKDYTSSRGYRRGKKKSKSTLQVVSQMKDNKKTTKSNQQINELTNNLIAGFNND